MIISFLLLGIREGGSIFIFAFIVILAFVLFILSFILVEPVLTACGVFFLFLSRRLFCLFFIR